MGGKRHKGIGYNRAKKRKVSPLVPVPDEPENTEDDDEEEDCSPPAYEPPMPPAALSVSPPQDPDLILEAVNIFYQCIWP